MNQEMFCFQCEQTAGCGGCTRAGVCGKSAVTAKSQDELTGALIGLARTAIAADCSADASDAILPLIIEGLFSAVTNVNFDDASVASLIGQVHRSAFDLALRSGTCAEPDYDLDRIWHADEDIRSLKSQILFGIRGMAAYASHAMTLGYTDDSLNRFFLRALSALAEDWGMDELLPVVMDVGRYNLLCMNNLRSTLSAFLSLNVLNYLMEQYQIAPTTTPEADLKELLS